MRANSSMRQAGRSRSKSIPIAIFNTYDLFQETLKELFPSWKAVRRYREVIIFAAGQMKDSRPLVQFVYEMQVEDYLNRMRTGHPLIDADLFRWLHSEATVRLFDHPLHNKYINYYDHVEDEGEKRPSDTIVYLPSTIYDFWQMMEDIVLGEYKEQRAEIPESAMFMFGPNVTVTKSLLSKCRAISEHQAVTDLRMKYVFYVDDATEAEAPILSRNIRSLHIGICRLPSSFMRNILQQLHDCVTLVSLKLHRVDLRKVEEDLDKLLDNLVFHKKGLSQEKLRIRIKGYGLPKEFVAKWNERCEGITSIDCDIYYHDRDDDDGISDSDTENSQD